MTTPQHCPSPRELDDLELLLGGALGAATRFESSGATLTLDLPAELADGPVELVDPEGLPLARRDPDGTLTELTRPEYGAFRRLRLRPAEVRERHSGATFVPVTGPLTSAQISRLAAEDAPIVLLALAGVGTPELLSPIGLVRATLAAAAAIDSLVDESPSLVEQRASATDEPPSLVEQRASATDEPPSLVEQRASASDESPSLVEQRASASERASVETTAVVVVPLAAHGDPAADHELGIRVVGAYAGDDRVLALPTDEDDASYPPAIESIIDFDRPVAEEQGLVLFFTGLSGSGKSTLAQALTDLLLEQGQRTVTSLDGDVVRRNLSAGLTFSREDRETNIRRIGWVAAEISRHGGIAVCSPIAPFDETRQQVRAMVEDAGGAFFLVHVATPLEECERRDRKGLYAKARRGEIPEFTGISSPYEEPDDADVRVDTTGRTVEAALEDVLAGLREAGYLDLAAGGLDTLAALAARPTNNSPVEPGDTTRDADTSPGDTTRDDNPSLVEPGEERARVETTPTDNPLKVLFVCTANICRSAFMERYAASVTRPGAVEFSSAGTHGFQQRAMDKVMATTLTARGIAFDDFRSRPLTRAMIEDADVVLTAEAAHRAFILDEQPAAFRKVFTLGQFDQAVRRSGGLSGRALLAHVAEHRGPADVELDIADPYGRGTQAANRCADEVVALLDAVIPRLASER